MRINLASTMTDALVSYLEGAAPWAIPLVMHPVIVLAAKVVMGLAAAALVVALASQVWVLVWRRRTRGMPGPGYWWLCGHLRDYHDASVKLAAKYGGIYNVFLGLRTMTVVSDPALLKEVLTNQKAFPKIASEDIFTSKRLVKFLGTSFLGLNGKEWLRVKSQFADAFHVRSLKPLIPLFHRRTARLLNAIVPRDAVERHAKTVRACHTVGRVPPPFSFEVDLKKWMARLGLDILGHSMLGADLGALPDLHVGKGTDLTPRPRTAHTCCTATGTDSVMMGAYVGGRCVVAVP